MRRVVANQGQIRWYVAGSERVVRLAYLTAALVRPTQVFLETAHRSCVLRVILLMRERCSYLIFAYWKDICRVFGGIFIGKIPDCICLSSFHWLERVVCDYVYLFRCLNPKSSRRSALDWLLRWVFKSCVGFGGWTLLLKRLVSWTLERLNGLIREFWKTNIIPYYCRKVLRLFIRKLCCNLLAVTNFGWVKATYTFFVFFLRDLALRKVLQMLGIVLTKLVFVGYNNLIGLADQLWLTPFGIRDRAASFNYQIQLNCVVLGFQWGICNQTPPKSGDLVVCRLQLLVFSLLVFWRVSPCCFEQEVNHFDKPSTVFEASFFHFGGSLVPTKLYFSPFLGQLLWSLFATIIAWFLESKRFPVIFSHLIDTKQEGCKFGVRPNLATWLCDQDGDFFFQLIQRVLLQFEKIVGRSVLDPFQKFFQSWSLESELAGLEGLREPFN